MVDFDKLVDQIVNLRDESCVLYLKKYTKSWLLSKIEDSDQVNLIEQKFKEYDVHGVDIIDFVRIMLNIIQHDEKETLYIVIALIEFFKDITESYNLITNVKCSDVINYIIDVNWDLIDLTYFHKSLLELYIFDPSHGLRNTDKKAAPKEIFWKN